jgi:hypothetical protein
MCQACRDNHTGPQTVDLALSRRGFLQAGMLLAGTVMGASLLNCGSEKVEEIAAVTTLPQPPRPPAPNLGVEIFPDPSGHALATAADAPVIILPRAAWTTAKPDLSDMDVMGDIDRITVHHTGMKTDYKSTSYKVAVEDIESIRDFHTTDKDRKWADIAYHYIIDPAGRVWQGRPLVYQGAHTKLNNEHNLGIVVMGDFENQFPAAVQLTTLAAFMGFVRKLYNVPVAHVYTHGELKSTECPGKHLQGYMDRARTRWAGEA